MSKKSCFVIGPIGDPGSDIRKRSDQVLRHVISPAVASCGYDQPVRADQISEPGLITSQVIQHIVDDILVVADLTDRNPNVFYELAIRHAIRKPLVQLISKDEQIPFDVAGTRTIHLDVQDLDSVEEAKNEMVSQIKHAEKNPEDMETPISVSLDLQSLKKSNKPQERSLADMLSGIAEVRAGLAALEKRLSDPTALLPLDYLDSIFRRFARHRDMQHHPAVHDLLIGVRAILSANPNLKKPGEFALFERAYDYLRRRLGEREDLVDLMFEESPVRRRRRPEISSDDSS
jgi:hypothetical protein